MKRFRRISLPLAAVFSAAVLAQAAPAKAKSQGLYWTEVERTRDDFSDPIVIDQYTPR